MSIDLPRPATGTMHRPDAVGTDSSAFTSQLGLAPDPSFDPALAEGLFVNVGDGTTKSTLEQQSRHCCQEVELALRAAHRTAQSPGCPERMVDSMPLSDAVPSESLAAEIESQETSLLASLQTAFNTVYPRIVDGLYVALPGMMFKGLEFGMAKMTSAGLQHLSPGLDPTMADEAGKALLLWMRYGVQLSLGMRSCMARLLARG